MRVEKPRQGQVVTRDTGYLTDERFPFYAQLKRAFRKVALDIAAHVALADPHTQYAKESDTAFNAPSTPDYLVGTTQAGLSAEIVVGATPGGELGGTWATPTVDATHSGSTHAATQAAAEATAAAALAAHTGDTSDAHDASAISIVDAGGDFTATDVEGALDELQADHEADAAALQAPHHTVRFAAGVPSGAPTTTELPIAFDSTAVTGGVYYWTGAAWVKGGTI